MHLYMNFAFNSVNGREDMVAHKCSGDFPSRNPDFGKHGCRHEIRVSRSDIDIKIIIWFFHSFLPLSIVFGIDKFYAF